MTFGEWLKGLLESRGVTQRALSEASGVGAGRIASYIYTGETPGLDNALRLARALGSSLAEWEAVAGAKGVAIAEAGTKQRGRPKKEEAEPKPKRPRGRPKKGKRKEPAVTRRPMAPTSPSRCDLHSD